MSLNKNTIEIDILAIENCNLNKERQDKSSKRDCKIRYELY
jgi:hypothetical protein|tara:strand:+ start:789 stop:911 length:123 start_codon:yes stop_codon:yes gene_type:complete